MEGEERPSGHGSRGRPQKYGSIKKFSSLFVQRKSKDFQKEERGVGAESLDERFLRSNSQHVGTLGSRPASIETSPGNFSTQSRNLSARTLRNQDEQNFLSSDNRNQSFRTQVKDVFKEENLGSPKTDNLSSLNKESETIPEEQTEEDKGSKTENHSPPKLRKRTLSVSFLNKPVPTTGTPLETIPSQSQPTAPSPRRPSVPNVSPLPPSPLSQSPNASQPPYNAHNHSSTASMNTISTSSPPTSSRNSPTIAPLNLSPSSASSPSPGLPLLSPRTYLSKFSRSRSKMDRSKYSSVAPANYPSSPSSVSPISVPPSNILSYFSPLSPHSNNPNTPSSPANRKYNRLSFMSQSTSNVGAISGGVEKERVLGPHQPNRRLGRRFGGVLPDIEILFDYRVRETEFSLSSTLSPSYMTPYVFLPVIPEEIERSVGNRMKSPRRVRPNFPKVSDVTSSDASSFRKWHDSMKKKVDQKKKEVQSQTDSETQQIA